MKRAKELGLQSKIPDNWNPDGSVGAGDDSKSGGDKKAPPFAKKKSSDSGSGSGKPNPFAKKS